MSNAKQRYRLTTKSGRRKIMFFDIEAAGVQGLKADRSFIPCFSYKWEGDKKPTLLSILDYPGKNCQDDTRLLKKIYLVMREAHALVAHFGEYFDRPFVDARFAQAGLPAIPNMRLTDTCLIARRRLCISSNRLANLAEFLKCDTKKMEKGRGWPDWWMGALRGHRESIRKMGVYCMQDVQCLEEVYMAMRHLIPIRDLPINSAIGSSVWTCPACGGRRKNYRGIQFSEMKAYHRIQCQECGFWTRERRAIDFKG